MTFSIAGGPIVGFTHFNESQLDRVVRRIRTGWRNLLNTLNQPGRP
jgi:hypothetical protein